MAISLAGTLPRDPMDALIISQVMTLGKGTTGSGANTVGPGGALYTSQAETGLPNNGYGSIAGGTRPTDTDNDGMPDDWESANGSNVERRRRDDEGRRRLRAGRALRELAGRAARDRPRRARRSTSILSAYATGFSSVSPTYAVSGAQNGTVTLQADGHTAQFQPAAGSTAWRVLVQGHRLRQHVVHGRGPGPRGAVASAPRTAVSG